MKRFLVICIILAGTIIEAQAVDWAVLSNVVSAVVSDSASTATETQIKTDAAKTLSNIQKQADAIDKEVQENFLSIVSIFSAKKESNSIKTQLNEIMSDKAKTDTEKAELVNKILTTYVTNISNNSSTASKLSKLSASKKLELIKQIALMEQSGQKYATLAKQAITTSASNMLASASTSSISAADIASVINQTNQTASLIKTKAANTINIAKQFRAIANNADIK